MTHKFKEIINCIASHYPSQFFGFPANAQLQAKIDGVFQGSLPEK